MVTARVCRADGTWITEEFLIDSGADATVLRADIVRALQLATSAPLQTGGLQGIGGSSAFVLVSATLEFVGSVGTVGYFQGQFAAFTSASLGDYSLLGRDILDACDVILSRRRDEVFLLTTNSNYQLTP
jgi:hypothetical protein